MVGTLPYSGRFRAVFCESEDQAHLISGIDGVLRRLGGTARSWRFDRMATVCDPGSGRLRSDFAAVARSYGVTVAICGARRANRKGAVESSNHYVAQRFWRTLVAATVEEAQAKLDGFCARTGDQRRRQGVTVGELAAGEGLQELPLVPYPATITVERTVSAACLVSYEGNRYSVPPGLHGQRVTVRRRLGQHAVELVSPAGTVVASHRLAPAGAGALQRHQEHRVLLEQVVLNSVTSARPCRRKANRPPGETALAAAAALTGTRNPDVVVDLERYAEYAQVAR